MPRGVKVPPEDVETLRRLREQGWTRAQAAAVVGCSVTTVTCLAPVRPFRPSVAPAVKQCIRTLRYVDGLSAAKVGEMLGVSKSTVLNIAPGRPGKVANAKLRAAFEASGLAAADVARSLGWECTTGPGGGGGRGADSVRVRRALGLQGEVSHGARRPPRTMIDAETAALIAEAIGVAPWSVGCDEDLSHLARAG